LTGEAKNIAAGITEFLQKKNISIDQLVATGCGGTNVNTAVNRGAIRLFEEQLGRPLQWLVCLLHANELPLRHLLQKLDVGTSGPKALLDQLIKG
jgi:hypothetical protein